MNKYQLVVLNQPRTCFSIKSKIFPFSPWLCIINSVTDTNKSLIKVRIILRFKKTRPKNFTLPVLRPLQLVHVCWSFQEDFFKWRRIYTKIWCSIMVPTTCHMGFGTFRDAGGFLGKINAVTTYIQHSLPASTVSLFMVCGFCPSPDPHDSA